MAEQHQTQKPSTTKKPADNAEATPTGSETGEKLKAELDDLLDEIDDVLETNAEEFVKSYIQKGGQ